MCATSSITPSSAPRQNIATFGEIMASENRLGRNQQKGFAMAITNNGKHHLAARLFVAMGMALAVPLVNACTPVEMAVEDRQGGDIARDTQIKAGLIADISREMSDELATRIGIDVYEQVVMLTGEVKSDAERTQLENIVRASSRVKRLYNEIQVVPEGTEAEGSWIDDVVVKQKFYGKLATTSGVDHTNWRYRSVNGVLYLFGRALSQGEMDKVIAIAKDTKDIQQVVNHAFVREKPASTPDGSGGGY